MIIVGDDGKPRCRWSEAAPEFIHYHDEEWGYPIIDDFKLFEKISLEGFQSGLSWRTILAKREGFRKAFDNFDFNIIATYKEYDIECLLKNPCIVRHRGKIEAAINNARCAKEMVAKEKSLAAFFWRYEPKRNSTIQPQTISSSAESIALSKELKKRGWKFVGPTTVFAFMQAMGIINDHAIGCFCRDKVDKERNKFERPS